MGYIEAGHGAKGRKVSFDDVKQKKNKDITLVLYRRNEEEGNAETN